MNIIYSWFLFLRVSTCLNMDSCQIFIKLIEFLVPSSIPWKPILGCNDLLTRINKMFQTFDATTFNNDLAWLYRIGLHLLCIHWWSCAFHFVINNVISEWDFKLVNYVWIVICIKDVNIHGHETSNVNDS